MPWINIPSATITFQGEASLHNVGDYPVETVHSLLRGLETDVEKTAEIVIVEIKPKGDFITYGVGVPLLTMRKPEEARGRAPVS
jgi:hypothetical protein